VRSFRQLRGTPLTVIILTGDERAMRVSSPDFMPGQALQLGISARKPPSRRHCQYLNRTLLPALFAACRASRRILSAVMPSRAASRSTERLAGRSRGISGTGVVASLLNRLDCGVHFEFDVRQIDTPVKTLPSTSILLEPFPAGCCICVPSSLCRTQLSSSPPWTILKPKAG